MGQNRTIVHENDPGEHKLGSLRIATNTLSSKIEEEVRLVVKGAGHLMPEARMSIWCRHPDRQSWLLALTPDIILPDHQLVIEVDPCSAVTNPKFDTHAGEEEKDRLRNDLFAEAGWTVIRMRLGALEGGQLGNRDVVCESTSLTRANKQALLDAVADFIAGRAPKVRFVAKAGSPKKSTGRASVLRINPFGYADDGHIFTWYQSLDSDEKTYMRLAMNGRFLCTHTKPPMFICEVGLQDVPKDQWRDRLELVLADKNLNQNGSGRLPWGDSFFVAADDGEAQRRIISDADRKTTLDDDWIEFTTNEPSLDQWDAVELANSDGESIVKLHDQALHLG